VFQAASLHGKRRMGLDEFYRQLDGPPLLLDMNYLAGFFRTELAEAVGRILSRLKSRSTQAS